MTDATNPYLDLLQAEDERQRVQQSATLATAIDVNPDRFATQRRVAGYLGYPVGAVEATPDESQREAQIKRVQADSAAHPVLQQRYSDADFAKLAHDDSGALSAIADYLGGAGKRSLLRDAEAGARTAEAGLLGVVRAAADWTAPVIDPLTGANPQVNPLRALSRFADERATAQEAEAKRLSPHTGDWLQGGVSAGVQSVVQNALTLPLALLGAPRAALGVLSLVSAGDAYQEAVARGLDPLSALIYAGGQGAIEAATEMIPLGKLLEGLQAGAPLYKIVAKQITTEVPGEQLATVLQDLNTWAALNPDKPFSEYLNERPSAAAQTLVATVIGVGGNVAIGKAVQSAIDSTVGDQRRVQQAKQDAQALQKLFALATGSKLHQRAPETLAGLVQEMADGSDDAPSELYIDARTLAGEGGLLNQEQLGELLPSVVPQIAEALAVGGDVVIPLGELVGKVAGTPLEQSLLEHLRTSPEALSQAEAKAAGDMAASYLQGAAAKAIEESSDAVAAQTSAGVVKQHVLDQLNAANRFTPEVHDAYASLVRDFYTTTSQRLGMTPEQMLAAYPLRIAAVNPARAEFAQAAYHGTPYRGIEKFSTGKIGSGEGAQVYGWGLYFAGNAEVAEFYRRNVKRMSIEGGPLDKDNPRHLAAATAHAAKGDRKAAVQQLRYSLDRKLPNPGGPRTFETQLEAAIAILESDEALPEVDDKGQTYMVEVPENDQLLDYDAPFDQQPETVRTALRKLGFGEPRIEVRSPEGELLAGPFGAIDTARRAIKSQNLNGRPTYVDFDLTGKEAYGALSRQLGGDQQASEALRAAGVSGLRYLDQNSRGKDVAEQTHNYVIFSGDDVSITNTFWQSRVTQATPAVTRLLKNLTPEEQAGITDKVAEKIIETLRGMPSSKEMAAVAYAARQRGTFNPATLQISLLEGADLSTFLHETGHFFLEVLADLSARADAPAAVRGDMNKLLGWFGVADLAAWNAMPLGEKRPHHEKFAESFEQYLFEGKAPSRELNALFQRFRSWLVNVYRSLADFLSTHNTQLSDEVRGVFDRLLASEQSIQEAEAQRAYAPLFASAEAAGMTAEEWTAYQATGQQASERATEKLQTRSLRDLRWSTGARAKALRALQKDAAAKRKAVEGEVRAELLAQPIEQARAWLAERQKAEAAQSKEHKAARATWTAEYDTAKQAADEAVKADEAFKTKAERKLEVQRRMLQWETEHPAPLPEVSEPTLDAAAALFGFSSADELSVTLRNTPPMAELLEGMTDQRLLERYGDLTTVQGMQRAADEAVHNETRARFIATGLRSLLEAKRPVNVLLAAAKQYAAGLVARRKVRELKPGAALAAETRAGKAALAAVAAGDTQAATVAQRDQLLNHYLARQTRDALDEIERQVRYLRGFSDNTTLPPEYRDQIDALLDRFELSRTPLKTLDKRQSLVEWVESQRAIGIDPELPPGLLNEAQRVNYRDMTVEQFRGLVDAVKQIEHLGRLKSRLLTAKDERDFEATRDTIAASIVANAGDRDADTRTPTTNLGRALQTMRNFGAAHIKAATWARILDGGKDGGPMWETFVRSANERGDQETTMRADATKALTVLLAPVFKGGKLGGKGVYFPSVKRSFNRESLIAIALNTGNEGNLQRLLGGENWTQEQLQPLLEALGAEDWGVVQAVWDHFETYKPLIGAKQKRVYGVEPDWVQPSPFQVQARGIEGRDASGKIVAGAPVTVNLRGGYYPIKYDPAASVRAEEHADAEGAKRQLQGAYGAATTRRSFTKARAEEVTGRPLLYTLAGLYSGVNDVIHDLAWHEWLIDTNRLLKSQTIDGAIRSHYGPAAVRQLKSWRDAVAEGDGATQEALDQALGRLRQGVSVAGLGFNVMSALKQPLGLTQSVVRVGAPWIARGALRYIANPLGATRDALAQSEFMTNRARTLFRELNEVRNSVHGQSTARRVADRYAYWLMMRVQQMVDVPTWHGAYEKAIADGSDDARAVALADQAVIDSQGSGMVKDLSAIERGGPAQKLFTVFYSYMNTALNLGVASGMTPRSTGRRFADMLLLYTVPAVLGKLLTDALTPGDSGDGDEDWKATTRRLLAEQLGYLMGLMVVVREFAEAGKTAAGLTDHARDYSGPAGVRAIADAGALAKQTQQGEFDDSFRKALVNLIGDLAGLPAAQINRTITGVQALREGKTQNPAAAVLGYQEPR